MSTRTSILARAQPRPRCWLVTALLLLAMPAGAFGPGGEPAKETLALSRWPEDEYTESLTLVAYLDDGTRLELGTQVTNLGIGKANGRYNMSYVGRGEPVYRDDEVRRRFHWTAPPLSLQMGEDVTQEGWRARRGVWLRTAAGSEGRPGHIIEARAAAKGLSFALRLRALTPLYRPGGGSISFGDRRLDLLIQMPRAEVEGELSLSEAGPPRKVRGIGYLEHGRSNADPRRHTDRQLRLRYFGEWEGKPLSVIAFDTVTAPADGERRFGFLAAFHGDRLLLTQQGPVLGGEGLRPDPQRPKNRTPTSFVLQGTGISLRAATERTVERYAYLDHVSGLLRLILQRFVFPVAYNYDCRAELKLELPSGVVQRSGWADCGATLNRP